MAATGAHHLPGPQHQYLPFYTLLDYVLPSLPLYSCYASSDVYQQQKSTGLKQMTHSFDELCRQLAEFAKVRDWEQFHSPKNLSMALIAEAAELIEHFQWLTEEQSENLSPEKLEEVRMEMADIQIYLMRLAERLGVDLISAAREKMALNEERYPAEKVKGSARRASEYEEK
jgi:NTP pyrophosphatase (non-canonical NTP hydrolase)